MLQSQLLLSSRLSGYLCAREHMWGGPHSAYTVGLMLPCGSLIPRLSDRNDGAILFSTLIVWLGRRTAKGSSPPFTEVPGRASILLRAERVELMNPGPGQSFALDTLHSVIAALLLRYRLHLAPGHEVILSPGGLLSPRDLKLRFEELAKEHTEKNAV